MALKKKEREILSQKYDGKCAYCGCELQKGWHADHIEPIRRNWWENTMMNPENDVFENYNPSCPKCNINKHSSTLEEFRENIKQYVQSLNKYSVQYQMAKKYNLINEADNDVKFYFETLNP